MSLTHLSLQLVKYAAVLPKGPEPLSASLGAPIQTDKALRLPDSLLWKKPTIGQRVNNSIGDAGAWLGKAVGEIYGLPYQSRNPQPAKAGWKPMPTKAQVAASPAARTA